MIRSVDQAVLLSFVAEAQGYLPSIQDGINAFCTDASSGEDSLEVAHRHIHTIRGAAAMVGLGDLSQVATCMEDTLDGIVAKIIPFNQELAALLQESVAQIDSYLKQLQAGEDHSFPYLEEICQAYQALAGIQRNFSSITLAASDPPPSKTSSSQSVIPSEDIPAELLETFTLEAEEHLRQLSLSLNALAQEVTDRAALQEVRRRVHTIKGAAGIVGLQVVSQLTHHLEDVLDHLYEDHVAITPDSLQTIFDTVYLLEDLITGVAQSEAVQSQIESLSARYAAILAQSPQQPSAALADITPLKSDLSASRSSLAQAEEGYAQARDVIRVPITRLDDLVNLVSELVITHTAFEQRMQDLVREVDELQPSLARLRRASSRLETHYEAQTLGGHKMSLTTGRNNSPNTNRYSVLGERSAAALSHLTTFQTYGFDELEFDRYTEFHRLSRELAETTSDIRSVGNQLNTLIGEFEGILNRQGRISGELQQQLMQTRMVPLSTLTTRLHRAVRVAAQRSGKAVDLRIEGEQVELDKTVLEAMADSLLHLLRNAVDHGIEPMMVRQTENKAARGLIQLRAYYEGSQVIIQVQDDGQGIDLAQIRQRAVEGNYLTEEAARQQSEEDLQRVLFLPGFSTAGEVNEVSGRGVGLDIVKASVHQLKGSLTLHSRPGEGTTFTIRLPMTLAITRGLLVKTHNETFAIPQEAIRQILRLTPDDFEILGTEPVVRVGEEIYPVIHLGEALQLKQLPDDSLQHFPVLILKTGEQEIALVVEYLLEGRDIVVKPLGDHLRQVHGISGATLMGDGTVVLILNPSQLGTVARTSSQPPSRPARSVALQSRKTASRQTVPTIMVVDDSISVRRVVANLLKSVGWQPLLAKDGLEALEILQQRPQPPDLVLLDIEMPRMDGYELTSTLRGQATYQDLPIVMLTSRAGDKHRRKATEVGVTDYIIKPYQDDHLLGLIRQLIHHPRD